MSRSKTIDLSRVVPWHLLTTVIIVPLFAWLQQRDWSVSSLTAYALFPLLGLWAWGIMWTHYAYGALFLTSERLERNALYTKITGYIVLALILLHPTLLVYTQWSMFGLLPPESYYSYVGQSLKIFVMFGSLSLLAFLGYEILHRLRSNKTVRKRWFLVSLSQMSAMVLIFAHSLTLGQHLQSGWLRYYWILLGLVLLPCFFIVGRADYKESKQT